jgi:coenzyme F420-0:L-glutamate ligase/coenzyme F420-1:gamma-L-glutamate ligase
MTSEGAVAASLQLQALAGIAEVTTGDDLAAIVLQACAHTGWPVKAGDCFVLAQKIVSKAEGRSVVLDKVQPSERALALAETCRLDAKMVELVLRESVAVVRAAPNVLIVRHRLGHVMANAGIDQSNVPVPDGRPRALLLPLDPDASARALALDIAGRTGVPVSVVVNDSFGRPWRQGVCGTALGVYGLPALRDRRGVPDRQGRPLRHTFVAMADEVAAAASLVMGQADEGRPVIAIRGLPFDPKAVGIVPVFRPAEQDLFR